jgi:hypothetical protein
LHDKDASPFPFQNATDDSILQQVLGVFSEGLSECWEAAYDGSVQFDPLKNSGAGQAGTVQLNAMLLKPGAYTIVEMEIPQYEGWKISEGVYITLTPELVQRAAMAFMQHYGKAFQVEAAKLAEIEALEDANAVETWLATELNQDW